MLAVWGLSSFPAGGMASCSGGPGHPAALDRPAAPRAPARSTHVVSASQAADPGARPPADGGPSAAKALWVSFYGTASQMGDLAHVARTFRLINIDADPGAGNFTDDEIRILSDDGRNRVVSYLNIGSCERFRTYWSSAPSGLVPCGANRSAWLGSYEGYPDETWMDPSDEAYQGLILDFVAPRLAARGVDGFYLDNLEVAEHADPSAPGWCSPRCRQGALDLVRRLRERFADMVILMQNATSDVTRLGMTGGRRFATLLDGVDHEEVYAPGFDGAAEKQLLLWQAMGMSSRLGHSFFVGVEDYVGSCANEAAARAAYAKGRARGFAPYVADESGSQKVICYWPF